MTNECLPNRGVSLTVGWLILLWLLGPLQLGAAQFVQLTAEIAFDGWHYWFFQDEKGLSSPDGASKSIFTEPTAVRCVVGTNTWMMEFPIERNANVTRWFTGTNIIEHLVITDEIPPATTKRISEISRFTVGTPRVGSQATRVYESADGHPGRPVRVADLMGLQARVCWLAFCSGPALKREGRKVYPPSDLWKELVSAPSGFADKISVFEDGLGLPKSVELFTDRGQLIFQYQVRQSTNVLGWNFPLEFYLVQYRPPHRPRTNSCELQLTAKGRVTAIGSGSRPEIPEEFLKINER